jgi:hypothetical protein
VGWALAYRRYSKDYVDAEAEARKVKRAMWRGTFVKPWEWRASSSPRGAGTTIAPNWQQGLTLGSARNFLRVMAMDCRLQSRPVSSGSRRFRRDHSASAVIAGGQCAPIASRRLAKCGHSACGRSGMALPTAN